LWIGGDVYVASYRSKACTYYLILLTSMHFILLLLEGKNALREPFVEARWGVGGRGRGAKREQKCDTREHRKQKGGEEEDKESEEKRDRYLEREAQLVFFAGGDWGRRDFIEGLWIFDGGDWIFFGGSWGDGIDYPRRRGCEGSFFSQKDHFQF